MSPFILTTKRPARPGDFHAAMSEAAGIDTDAVSRRAVATLEEARQAVTKAAAAVVNSRADLSDFSPGARRGFERRAAALPESGGAITLPDGTVIEVERVGLADVALETGLSFDDYGLNGEQAIIDAFNAREVAA